MKVYSHYRRRLTRLPLILLGLAGVAALAGLVWSLGNGLDSEPPFPVFLVVLAIVAVNLFVLAGTATEIRLEDDGKLELVSPLRSWRVGILDIVSIAPSDTLKGAVYVLKHTDGKVRFDPKLNGMHELVAELKRQNPRIELKGI
jgi:hypothetical protein